MSARAWAVMGATLCIAAVAAFAGLVVSGAAQPHPQPPSDAWRASLAGHDVLTLGVSALALSELPTDRGLVVPSEARPTPSELDAIVAFAQRGGRVLIVSQPALAERFGISLSALPASAIDGGDVLVNGRRVVDAHPLAGPGAPLLLTQNATFVDADGDGRASAGDVAGPFVIALAHGTVVVAGASSGVEDLLVRAAFEPGAPVLLDDATSAPWAAAALRVSHEPAADALVATPLVLGAAFLARAGTMTVRSRAGPSLDEPLRRRAP